MATHLPLHGDGFAGAIPFALFLCFLWLSALLYKPEMFPVFISKIFHKAKKTID